MYTWTFWILTVWLIVNGIWMWSVRDNQNDQKIFAWVNVVALIWGFWVYFGVPATGNLGGWLLTINIITIVLAIFQFYYGYKKE